MTLADSRERLADAFEAFGADLRKHFVRVPAHLPRLDFVDDPRSPKLAELTGSPGGGCSIRIHRPLLERLEELVAAEGPVLNAACLGHGSPAEPSPEAAAALKACVLDVAETFALLHECSHFWCGHWDALGRGASLDENQLHLAADASEPVHLRSLRAYYLELEADASALQLLLQKLDFGSLRRLFATLGQPFDDGDDAALYALNDQDRSIGFRVLLAAIWIVIQLFENRKAQARTIQRSHPLPSARLLGAILTTMAQYAELTGEEFDIAGFISQHLTHEQKTDLQQFFREVLAPVLSAGWHVSDDAASHVGFRTAPDWIAREVGQLLAGGTLASAAAQELTKVQGLRAHMARQMGPLRYLPYALP